MPTTQYPMLMQYARRKEALAQALQRITDSEQKAYIRNVHYQEAKATLNLAFEQAWEGHVMRPFVFTADMNRQDPVIEGICAVNASSLYDAISAHRRVSQLDPSHPAAAAAMALLNEAQPLAERVVSLKAHIIKGRQAPETPTQRENPHKVIGSCPCCFRGIAVLQTTGRMAHHGYRRPLEGMQSASCPGIRFKPLEESTEGLEWMIGVYAARVSELRSRLAAAPTLVEIKMKRSAREEARTVRRGDPDWNRVHASHMDAIGREIGGNERSLDYLRAELDKWSQRLQHSTSAPKKPRRPRPRG